MTSPRRQNFIRWACSASLLLTASSGFAQPPRDERPPVSWVNSELPRGPGLSHHVLESAALGHEVGYVVWTPPGYEDRGEARIPVIYFLHGMGGNEAADSAGFSGLLARGIRDGVVAPAICVFPNGGRSGYRGEIETMIVEELIPRIDADYATIDSASGRAVAGFSMGGAGSVRLALLHPELFCAAGSWGGGLWRGGDEILAAVKRNVQPLQASGFAALLVNGEQDRPDAFAALATVCDELDIPCEVSVLPEVPHNLGLYYERSGEAMVQFLGRRLREAKQPAR